MKKASLAVLLMGTCLACFGVSVAKAPILFKGLDEVPFASVCSSDITDNILYEDIKACTPKINDYAGEKLIKRSENEKDKSSSYLNYSHIEFDAVTKKILSMNFTMRPGAFDNVKEILEDKYGKSQEQNFSTGQYWYGDKDGETFIVLTTEHISVNSLGKLSRERVTQLTIITSAMRKARYALSERRKKVDLDNKLKASKGL